ncbi:MAG TPA: class I SAM-dependent methyltransferase [Candidatus Limnocylindrales bacterium]|jgi:SAM-dependent methyltransferase
MVGFFDNAYRDGGRPTWDIGRPQGALVRLAGSGLIVGSVLDAGCGTGENALYLAARGHRVLGVDVAAAAIERAAGKAADRGLPAEFLLADALDLAALDRTFDTVLDVGLFHTLDDAERLRYAASLGTVLGPGGRAFVLCWSDRNPFGRGPRRISPGEIRETFLDGWRVEAIDPEWLETRLPDGRIHAWLARIVRTATGT